MGYLLGQGSEPESEIASNAENSVNRRRAHCVIACLALLASANYLPSKFVLGYLDPFTFVAYRFTAGAVAVFLMLPRESCSMPLSDLGRSAVTGLLFGIALVPLLMALALTHSGITAFLVGSCALFVPVFEYAVMRRIPTVCQIIGLSVGVIGMAMISVRGDLTLDAGTFWGLVSAVLFAGWAVALSYFGKKVPSRTLGLGQIYSVTLVFGAAALLRGTLTTALPWQAWMAVCYLGVVGVALRFLVQSAVQPFTTATNVEIIFLLEPLFAFIWATVVGHESASAAQMAGCGTIVVGVLIAQYDALKNDGALRDVVLLGGENRATEPHSSAL